MITALVLQAALGALGKQALPPSGCAAFLWSRSEPPQLVAMVAAEPGSLRLQVDGKPVELPRIGADGIAGRGLAATSRYAAGEVSATVELSALERPDLTAGALVPQATLTVERKGHDTIIAPAGGLIGCAPVK
jgi:hypothetical protein